MAKSGKATTLRPQGAPGPGDTHQALVRAAIETLRSDGFGGASARTIAARAGCNQSLVFYHFGSVANLLLAALDSVSATRLDRYAAAVEQAASPTELVEVAAAIFREDLDAGYVTVLTEMIAGASSTPGLGPEVAARIEPWRQFAQRIIETVLADSPLGSVLPPAEAAHGIVALYLGLELLAHLDGDSAPALALFERAKLLTPFLEAMK